MEVLTVTVICWLTSQTVIGGETQAVTLGSTKSWFLLTPQGMTVTFSTRPAVFTRTSDTCSLRAATEPSSCHRRGETELRFERYVSFEVERKWHARVDGSRSVKAENDHEFEV